MEPSWWHHALTWSRRAQSSYSCPPRGSFNFSSRQSRRTAGQCHPCGHRGQGQDRRQSGRGAGSYLVTSWSQNTLGLLLLLCWDVGALSGLQRLQLLCLRCDLAKRQRSMARLPFAIYKWSLWWSDSMMVFICLEPSENAKSTLNSTPFITSAPEPQVRTCCSYLHLRRRAPSWAVLPNFARRVWARSHPAHVASGNVPPTNARICIQGIFYALAPAAAECLAPMHQHHIS